MRKTRSLHSQGKRKPDRYVNTKSLIYKCRYKKKVEKKNARFLCSQDGMDACKIWISSVGRSLLSVSTSPTLWTTFIPELIRPNMVCFPSNHWVGTRVIKNWLPFVSGPLLAMDKMPAPAKINVKNFFNYDFMQIHPLPPLSLTRYNIQLYISNWSWIT